MAIDDLWSDLEIFGQANPVLAVKVDLMEGAG